MYLYNTIILQRKWSSPFPFHRKKNWGLTLLTLLEFGNFIEIVSELIFSTFPLFHWLFMSVWVIKLWTLEGWLFLITSLGIYLNAWSIVIAVTKVVELGFCLWYKEGSEVTCDVQNSLVLSAVLWVSKRMTGEDNSRWGSSRLESVVLLLSLSVLNLFPWLSEFAKVLDAIKPSTNKGIPSLVFIRADHSASFSAERL